MHWVQSCRLDVAYTDSSGLHWLVRLTLTRTHSWYEFPWCPPWPRLEYFYRVSKVIAVTLSADQWGRANTVSILQLPVLQWWELTLTNIAKGKCWPHTHCIPIDIYHNIHTGNGHAPIIDVEIKRELMLRTMCLTNRSSPLQYYSGSSWPWRLSKVTRGHIKTGCT